MMIIADVLLIAGALGAGLYCYVLSRRLRRFTDLEKGVGGAVAVMSAQVDDLTRTLSEAQKTAKTAVFQLEEVNARADLSRQRLELLVASLHDLPIPPSRETQDESAYFVRRTQTVGHDL